MTDFPTTLRTGLHSGDTSDITHIQAKLMALVFLLVKKAATTAAVYCKHQGISEVDVPHIRLALKHESMHFFDSDNLERDTDTMISEISSRDQTISLETRDIGPILDTLIDQIERDTEREQTTLLCRCEICRGMETVADRWEAYEPDDAAKAFLKQQMEYIDTLYDESSDENFAAE